MQSNPVVPINKFFASLAFGRVLHHSSIYLHEMGHGAACKLVYSPSSANISMKGFLWLKSSCMCMHIDRLSSFGAVLGKDFSEVFLAAGGPIVDIFLTLNVYSLIAQTNLLSKRNCAAIFIPRITHLFLATLGPLLSDEGDYGRIYLHGGVVPYIVLALSANYLSYMIAKNAFSNIPWRKLKVAYQHIKQKIDTQKSEAKTTKHKLAPCSFHPLARRTTRRLGLIRSNPFLNFFSLIEFLSGR